ncbi:MAG: Glycerol-3-phosphate cytidylyltransferase [Opitutia bacterium UBA7350]|nr:MAG: Glycerol-3-phosphate cytidylyltransferase [Opitutae bacterium UBA7350]
MKKIFVSGCYDIIHAGHIQFFSEARALGDHLTVCFASDDVLWQHKERRSSLPQEHKLELLRNLSVVDDALVGENDTLGLDFQDHFRRIRPDILAVTEDDQHEGIKKALCQEIGTQYIKLPKTPPKFKTVSTSGIVKWIQAPDHAPVRVDFGGGWLDVPRFARQGAFIVNCAVSPTVSLQDWQYEKRSGLGGSGAWALLNGKSGVLSELDLGVGWQDPAIITETGLCVWKSGPRPELALKRDGELLQGKMALLYTGSDHNTPSTVDIQRDYDRIETAGKLAARAVDDNDLQQLAKAIQISYQTQLNEGMQALPEEASALAAKYCGGGYGGYALYLFAEQKDRDAFVTNNEAALAIEPYLKSTS